MSEQEKGVTVTTDGTPSRHTHPEGKHVAVVDGHLFVKSGESIDASVLAIYAPGLWKTAVAKR